MYISWHTEVRTAGTLGAVLGSALQVPPGSGQKPYTLRPEGCERVGRGYGGGAGPRQGPVCACRRVCERAEVGRPQPLQGAFRVVGHNLLPAEPLLLMYTPRLWQYHIGYSFDRQVSTKP